MICQAVVELHQKIGRNKRISPTYFNRNIELYQIGKLNRVVYACVVKYKRIFSLTVKLV